VLDEVSEYLGCEVKIAVVVNQAHRSDQLGSEPACQLGGESQIHLGDAARVAMGHGYSLLGEEGENGIAMIDQNPRWDLVATFGDFA